MKSHFLFIIQVVSAFFASFFTPMNIGKQDDYHVDALANSRSLVGKKVRVSECITGDAGMVKVSGTDWGARISKDCSATRLEPGAEVTIKYLVGSLLYVC